jgi:predicted nuclease of predicted toxin-antitoxin system
MLKLAADAGFNGKVFKTLLRREPTLDIVRAQDVGLRTVSDPDILEWAASEGRILVTHDKRTMPDFAYDRVRAGLPMPGVLLIEDQSNHVGDMVEEILLVAHCSEQHEWADQVRWLPI